MKTGNGNAPRGSATSTRSRSAYRIEAGASTAPRESAHPRPANAPRESACPSAEPLPHRSRSFNRYWHSGRSRNIVNRPPSLSRGRCWRRSWKGRRSWKRASRGERGGASGLNRESRAFKRMLAVVQVRGEPLIQTRSLPTPKNAKITLIALITLILSDPQESRPHRMAFTHSTCHPATAGSPTHPLTHSPTHPLTHSPTHPLTHCGHPIPPFLL